MATRVRFPEALLKDVGDLGQVSPHVFGHPGTGSISQMYGSGSGSVSGSVSDSVSGSVSGSGSFPFLINVLGADGNNTCKLQF
jgi:hypothetical protein